MDGHVIEQAAAPSIGERAIQTIADTSREAWEAVKPSLTWVLWLGLGLAAVLFWSRRSTTMVYRQNPRRSRRLQRARVQGILPGRVVSMDRRGNRLSTLRYRRTGRHAGYYRHRFKGARIVGPGIRPGTRMVALRDGTLRVGRTRVVPTHGKRLWGYY